MASSTVMVPGSSKCSDPWETIYSGYLASTSSSRSDFICVKEPVFINDEPVGPDVIAQDNFLELKPVKLDINLRCAVCRIP